MASITGRDQRGVKSETISGGATGNINGEIREPIMETVQPLLNLMV